jgi:hypothetical protein
MHTMSTWFWHKNRVWHRADARVVHTAHDNLQNGHLVGHNFLQECEPLPMGVQARVDGGDLGKDAGELFWVG